MTTFTRPLLCDWGINDYEWTEEEHSRLKSSLDCRRLLLEAGADPMAIADKWGDNALIFTVDTGTVVRKLMPSSFCCLLNVSKESLRMLLDLGGEFIDLEYKDSFGRTALHILACKSHSMLDSGRLELLLGRGASLHAQDDDGRTCLQYAVSALASDGPEYPSESETKRYLVLLIRAGADIHAADNDGWTPLDEGRCLPPGRRRIWRQALEECGICDSEDEDEDSGETSEDCDEHVEDSDEELNNSDEDIKEYNERVKEHVEGLGEDHEDSVEDLGDAADIKDTITALPPFNPEFNDNFSSDMAAELAETHAWSRSDELVKNSLENFPPAVLESHTDTNMWRWDSMAKETPFHPRLQDQNDSTVLDDMADFNVWSSVAEGPGGFKAGFHDESGP